MDLKTRSWSVTLSEIFARLLPKNGLDLREINDVFLWLSVFVMAGITITLLIFEVLDLTSNLRMPQDIKI